MNARDGVENPPAEKGEEPPSQIVLLLLKFLGSLKRE
jgi:hypothetical protein